MLSVEDVQRVIVAVDPRYRLVVQLLYGSGLRRLLEALTLRVKDVDFGRGQLTIRDPKWKCDRTTIMPRAVTEEMHEQLAHARLVHQDDLAAGFGRVWLPEALSKKFPRAAVEWRWQWIFPAPTRWRDAEGREGRHHIHETNVQRAVHDAARETDLGQRVTCHTTSAPSSSCWVIATSRRR